MSPPHRNYEVVQPLTGLREGGCVVPELRLRLVRGYLYSTPSASSATHNATFEFTLYSSLTDFFNLLGLTIIPLA
jgi:hypothetical protein